MNKQPKLKIMVVDDDFVSRTKMQAILADLGECKPCDGGQMAVAAFVDAHHKKVPFDIITLDIDMPDMSGKEALRIIRNKELRLGLESASRVKILMVTAMSDRQSVLVSLRAGCDGYVTKPFDKVMMLEKFKTFGLLPDSKSESLSIQQKPPFKDTLNNTIKALRAGKLTLPAKPALYEDLKQLLLDGADLNQAAQLLRKHAVVTGHLIRASNTGIYFSVKPSTNVVDAISRLGSKATLREVHTISIRSIFSTLKDKYAQFSSKFTHGSLCCAFACEIIASELDIEMDSDPFVLGLMHNIGKNVMLQIIADLEKRDHFPKKLEGQDIMTITECCHGLFAATMLKQWGFSSKYQEVARYYDQQHDIKQAQAEMDLVHFANQILLSLTVPDAAQQLVKDYAAVYKSLDVRLMEEIIANISMTVAQEVDAVL